MAKRTSVLVRMVSTAETGFYYVARKNPRTKTEKFKMRKYDPVIGEHVEFTEKKI